MKQRIVFSHQLATDLALAMTECEHERVFILTDETTKEQCWPLLDSFYGLRDATQITIKATDTHKTIETVCDVWRALDKGMATRHSLLINLGGGMVTDLGGFAASTFKRGIDFINIPTTLLAMVDASVGGKTGFNFDGLKNEIGVFNDAKFVILDTEFLRTLDAHNVRSGYAEMLKHGLISDNKHWADLLNFNLAQPDLKHLQTLLAKSVGVKEKIVEKASILTYPYFVNFDINEVNVVNRERVNLKNVADMMKDAPAGTKFNVVGYADKATGSAERNAWLAENRAKNVYNTLINEFGVPAGMLVLDSKGGVDDMFYNSNELSRAVIISKVK